MWTLVSTVDWYIYVWTQYWHNVSWERFYKSMIRKHRNRLHTFEVRTTLLCRDMGWGLFQKSIKTDFEPLKKMLERHSSVHSTKIFAMRKYLLLTQRHKGVFYPSPSPKYWTKFGSSYKPWHSLMHNRGNYLRHCKYILNANTQRMLINVGESWYCGSYLPKVISRIIIWNLFQVTHISPAQVHLWKAYPCQIGELLCK